jgi:hypothetical protein
MFNSDSFSVINSFDEFSSVKINFRRNSPLAKKIFGENGRDTTLPRMTLPRAKMSCAEVSARKCRRGNVIRGSVSESKMEITENSADDFFFFWQEKEKIYKMG